MTDASVQDRLADQVKAIKRRGGIVDAPGGLPEVEPEVVEAVRRRAEEEGA